MTALGPLIQDDLFHDKPKDLLALDHTRRIPQFGKILAQRDNLSAVRRGKRYRLLAAPTLVFNVDGHNPPAESLFTQSVMQNPTGTDMSPHVALKVLQAAERHNFTVVEDDIFCDLQVKTTPGLATLDQLDRVIYVRIFSKTLSGSLRVGFVACSQKVANELADIKMLTSITTSPFSERLIFAEPAGGMFVWARFPHLDDSLALTGASQRDGIMLAPGTVFRPHLERSPWMRFNIAVCEDTRVQHWLQRQAADKAA